jgi:pimeloyl-ACP methyl ester carboxylesterase
MTDAEYIATQKSTIVRSHDDPRLLPLMRAGSRVLSSVAPALAARLAERLFLTPPRAERPATETDVLATARPRAVGVGGRQIATWTWGAGPSVLLVHGWGGRGAQFGAFVDPLVARGFSVVTFDGPGHGASGSGPATIPEMTRAIREVAASRGRLAGLIAHSVGAVAATRALYEGLEVGRAVYVGPPSELVSPAVRFTERLGFSRAVRDRMLDRIEARIGQPWSAFDVMALAPALTTRLLVIHDRGDAEVPWQHGVSITRDWPGAAMLTTDGLGHRRILRAPDVVAAAVAFLAAPTGERGDIPPADADLADSLAAVASWAGLEARRHTP